MHAGTQAVVARHRNRAEQALTDGTRDFTSKYMAVRDLRALASSRTEALGPSTLLVLERLLTDPWVRRQTQAYFFFREVTGALTDVITARNGLSGAAHHLLKNLLADTTGVGHRAAAEALGNLPVHLPEWKMPPVSGWLPPSVSWNRLWDQVPFRPEGPFSRLGRSFAASTADGESLVVVKTARHSKEAAKLEKEAWWMRCLAGLDGGELAGFQVPKPIPVNGRDVVQLNSDSPGPPGFPRSLESCYALCFAAPRGYYTYPNAGDGGPVLPGERFLVVMNQNARILGGLTARGILHTALIPLFHNRVQRRRRNDRGRYEWPRAGRLDRWLSSCAYPNLAVTGLRDFEHLIPFTGSTAKLYLHMGAHFLSLFLVMGSYFRNRDPGRAGLDAAGNPVDARDLFDPDLLEALLREAFFHYYEGFVGAPCSDSAPFSWKKLAGRMVEEMGVDRHMEEILRVSDQAEMSDAAFQEQLVAAGISPAAGRFPERGRSDVTLLTGPHLGGFNHRISLPEMIEAVASLAALCVAGRHWQDRP